MFVIVVSPLIRLPRRSLGEGGLNPNSEIRNPKLTHLSPLCVDPLIRQLVAKGDWLKRVLSLSKGVTPVPESQRDGDACPKFSARTAREISLTHRQPRLSLTLRPGPRIRHGTTRRDASENGKEERKQYTVP